MTVELITILLFTCALFLMGMEGLGGSSDIKFPKPKLNYGATITDSEGVVHKANFISVNGKTSITGLRGKANITVNFNRVASATFSKTETKTWVTAHVVLRSGREIDLKVKGLARCYGMTDLGEMSVRMRDLRQIVFDKELPANPEK